MATKIIDVSTWQGNIDWSKVKADGVQGAIIRAGFGKVASQKDNKFEQNYKNAKAVGMPIGAYWYSYATSVADAKQEAEVCISILKGKQFEYPIYYDLEDRSMTGCGKSVLTQIATTFCETLENAGYFVGIYSNPNWLNNYLDYNIVKKYTLWLAHWGVSEPSYKCGLWQYSSSGSVSGISGRIDMNWGYQDFPTEIKNGKLNGFGESTSTPTPDHKPSKPATSTGFKVGDTVRVKKGAKTYDGGNLADFVYTRDHKISELSGDRAVITYGGVVVAAVNTKDLTKGGSSASSSTKPTKPATSSIKVGDTVKVKKGAKTYNGGSLASFVYDRNHKVSEVSGDRAVITYGGTVVAAVNTKDLTKVGGSTSSSASSPSKTIKKGSKVRVKNGAKTYDGGGLASFVYSTTYDVLEVSGDRVVIGIGSAVTAAVHSSDLTLVG